MNLADTARELARLKELEIHLTRERGQLMAINRDFQKYKTRLHWLHTGSGTDPEGYEWGVFRVKWQNGVAVSVLHTLADLSDLDAEIAREEKGNPCPSPTP